MVRSPRLGRLEVLAAVVVLLASTVGCGVQHSAQAGAEEEDETGIVSFSNGSRCGTERWGVKTGTDPDASSVDLAHVKDTTIGALVAYPAPGTIPLDSRVAPAETTSWRLTNVQLLRFKQENDSDYHLVLSDGSNTMIAEIPSPGCVSGGPFASSIQAARSAFDAKHQASGSFQTVNETVTVVGVGMFDFLHGQSGVAPNGIELHAVLGICFGSNCMQGGGGGSTSLALSPASATVAPGASTQFTVQAQGSGADVTLSVSGLPQDATATFNPSVVSAGGSSTLTVSVPSTEAGGSFQFTVTGTAGGSTQTASGVLSVSGSGGATTGSAAVSFEVDNAYTQWGQNVYVVGDAPELGNWDTSQAVQLSPTAYPSWTATLNMAQGEVASFKFILKDASGNVTWENGGNRQLTVPYASTGSYVGSWQ